MTTEQLFGTNCVAMVTPMTKDGELDEHSLGRLVDHLVATGCDGIVVAGTAGEAPTLTDAETEKLVAAVVSRVDGRTKVTAGVGTYDTAASVARKRRAPTGCSSSVPTTRGLRRRASSRTALPSPTRRISR